MSPHALFLWTLGSVFFWLVAAGFTRERLFVRRWKFFENPRKGVARALPSIGFVLWPLVWLALGAWQIARIGVALGSDESSRWTPYTSGWELRKTPDGTGSGRIRKIQIAEQVIVKNRYSGKPHLIATFAETETALLGYPNAVAIQISVASAFNRSVTVFLYHKGFDSVPADVADVPLVASGSRS